VIVAAGNAYGERVHARMSIPAGSFKQLRWSIAPDDPTDSYMEVWLPPQDDDGHAPVVAVRLVPPPSLVPAPPLAGAGESWFGVPTGTQLAPVCSVVHPTKAPNGKIGSMVLVTVGPTHADAAPAASAPVGTWIVEIHNQGAAPLTAHAWIERDDP